MPEFRRSEEVEQICYEMRLSDFQRGMNRARINELFNGFPPWSVEEEKQNQIEVNVNFLEPTILAHDARAQYYNSFMKPGNYFDLKTDFGPVHRRETVANKVTRNMNKIMKRSLPYFEKKRSTFATLVLHGVGPGAWRDGDIWCPDPMGMEDMLIPARTFLTFKNLTMMPVYRSFTAPELMKLTRGPEVDPGWNMPLVEACLEWIDKETMQLMGSNWPEVWAPEKAAERVKGDGGFYVGDQVPTIDCWDFYFYDERKEKSGWRRKIILDSWSMPAAAGAGGMMPTQLERKGGDIYASRDWRGQFLYDMPANQFFCDDHRNIAAFNFADLSAVGPFQYHSVRGLGFLLYAVCHLQNRLRCRLSEAVFESLLMYFRVKSMDDVQRALQVNLINRGFIDETIVMVPDAERYKVNVPVVELGMQQNNDLIAKHSTAFRPERDYAQDKREKTATQVMAEANQAASLASIALQQSYQYDTFENYEIVRRFFKKNSTDPDVKKFQAACSREGVPDRYMVAEVWEVSSDRVMGGGNKTLEMAIANQLMQWREKFDSNSQRTILYDATLALTDNADKAEELVPEKPVAVTDSIHDAQNGAGAIYLGLPVKPKSGVNNVDYAEALLTDMAVVIQGIGQGVPTPEQLTGLQNLAHHAAEHIQAVAPDEQQKGKVKELGRQLKELMKVVTQLAAKLQQQMKQQQAQAAQNGGGKAQEQALKLQATIAQAKAKMQNTRQSHAQRTAQRDIQFEADMRHKEQEHQLKLRQEAAHTQLELHSDAARTAAEIQNNRLKSLSEPDDTDA